MLVFKKDYYAKSREVYKAKRSSMESQNIEWDSVKSLRVPAGIGEDFF